MLPHFDLLTLISYILIGWVGAYCLKLSLDYNKSYPFSKQTGYILFYIVFVSLATLRMVDGWLVGIDSEMYELQFINCNDSSTSRFDEEEILFGIFNKVIRFFTSSPIIYRYVCYSIIVIGYIIFIKSFCRQGVSCIPFIILLLPYLKSLNTMRTSMAIAMILIGLVWLKERHIVRGIVLVCLSVFVHRMSILYVLFLPFYAIFRKNKYLNSNIKLIIIILIVSATGYYLGSQVQQYVIAASMLDAKDNYYLSKSLEGSILDGAITLLPLIFIAGMWLFCNNRLIWNRDIKFLALMVSFDIIILPTANLLGMWRANEYFFVARLAFWAYLIPVFVSSFELSSRKILRHIFTILFTAWLTYRIMREWEPCGLMPYKFFFQ